MSGIVHTGPWFLPDKIVLRFFKWDLKTQTPGAIDTLEPFHTTELGRPA
jgi:hypothetical protein